MIGEDEFPFDKPELANAAASRFAKTQESAVVRDLALTLSKREAKIIELRRQRDVLLEVCKLLRQYHAESTDQKLYTPQERAALSPPLSLADLMDLADDAIALCEPTKEPEI